MFSRRRSRSRSRYRTATKSRYSSETFTSDFQMQGAAGANAASQVTVVPAISSLGARKVKNFTLDIAVTPMKTTDTTTHISTEYVAYIYWALVYLPDGLTKTGNDLTIGAGSAVSILEPNQNVIMAGIVDSQNPRRFSTRLSRILDSGDSVVLLTKSYYASQGKESLIECNATLNYAITY